MKRSIFFSFLLFFYTPSLFAQNIDCDAIILFLNQKEVQITQLNLNAPDYIPLHYLVSRDIIRELKQFKKEVISNYSECKTITFSELINKYDELNNSVLQKYDSLSLLNQKVYFIFYEKAIYEYQFNNEEDGKYFLDRSLQYNSTYPNAVLLKLNKLLDENRFQECLSLLNTLYYETEMDPEQEKQAIEYTDKFYDKLYKTADSLLKLEHATEALELFEVLEIFCQNLPAAYCNDDYYHGVLNSKTGIYESYIAIAKVANKRGNTQIAERFYQYAQDYLESTPHLKDYEFKSEITTEPTPQSFLKVSIELPVLPPSTLLTVQKEEEPMESEEPKEQPPVEKVQEVVYELSPKELKEKYNKMVLQALALCIKEEFSASYSMFKEAKKLEDCRCFTTDFRVDLMLRELLKLLDL